jgi:glucose/arabinose dehydrogenase
MNDGRNNITRAPRRAVYSLAAVAMAFAFSGCVKTEGPGADNTATASSTAASAACPTDNGGITLPAGFCATVFADTIGHARHIVVNSNGDVYVNTWSGRYYTTPAHPGGFLVAMRDTNSDGKADIIKRFGPEPVPAELEPESEVPDSLRRNMGGTGIGIYNGSLYAEESSGSAGRIVRYAISTDSMTPTSASEIIVAGLPVSGGHPMHPFAIGPRGDLYVNSGSSTNSCQVKERTTESPGRQPCTELLTRAGIWRYDANRTNQKFSPKERYATGIRNAVGLAIDPAGQLYATQHGRDQLRENWPKLYTIEQGQNQPAEELLRIEQGGDYGWPYCYYDDIQRKLVLAPEYGGDGGKAVGDCATKKGPAAFFPAHWAPNGLLFYSGSLFPASYRNGAFIAFHGSWNRAPGPQQGYNVVFVPFARGNAADTAKYQIFADGFAGARKDPGAAAHRPSGVAQGPDGSLYITDDKAGRVWRVVYRGTAK